jgi:hypothetical protein
MDGLTGAASSSLAFLDGGDTHSSQFALKEEKKVYSLRIEINVSIFTI